MKNKFSRSPRVRSPKVEKPVDEIEEVQENIEDDEKKNIEEIDYVSDKSLEDDEEADVERDALTVATTALESTFNDTVDQKSPEEESGKLELYEKEYQSLLD